MGRLIAIGCTLGLLAAACSPSNDASSDETVETGETSAEPKPGNDSADDPTTFFPEILDVRAEQTDDGAWTFSVTLSSPYDTPEQYADAWRVVGPDGSELGFRLLTHDHANEQPFTRSQSGIVIPDGVDTVTIEARDRVNGWATEAFEFEVPA